MSRLKIVADGASFEQIKELREEIDKAFEQDESIIFTDFDIGVEVIEEGANKGDKTHINFLCLPGFYTDDKNYEEVKKEIMEEIKKSNNDPDYVVITNYDFMWKRVAFPKSESKSIDIQ